MSDTTITGNLGRDFELRYSPSGSANARNSIAVTRKWKDGSGADKEQTSWFPIVLWAGVAENAAESLSKGDRVIASGRLEQRDYEKDGEKKSIIELVVYEIGPSLRWATASVKRTEKVGGGGAAPAPEFGDEPF